jgi:hypothetical protein
VTTPPYTSDIELLQLLHSHPTCTVEVAGHSLADKKYEEECSPLGELRLTIVDDSGGDTGTLFAWSLIFTF